MITTDEILKQNTKDEQLKCVFRNRRENKYHSNLRHGYVIGNHIFFGLKDGNLTYVSIDGVYMEKPLTNDVLMCFIEYDDTKNKFIPCPIDKASASNQSTEASQIIAENNFTNMRISDKKFMFLMYYLRSKCNSQDEFERIFPVRISNTTRTVYITPKLSERIDEKLSELNQKKRG